MTSKKEQMLERAIDDMIAQRSKLQAALKSVPIPSSVETKDAFNRRMNEWLNGTYKAAMKEVD